MSNFSSAGGIVLRSNRRGVKEVLLVTYRSGRLGFPKGRRRKRETLISAAKREVSEETGMNFIPRRLLGYVQRAQGKRVYLFLGKAEKIRGARGDQETVWAPLSTLSAEKFEYLEDYRFFKRHHDAIRK